MYRAVALTYALCFASEPRVTFPGTWDPALLSCVLYHFLLLQRQLHFWWIIIVPVIFQLTHGYIVKILIKYYSCLEQFRKPVLTSLMMIQRAKWPPEQTPCLPVLFISCVVAYTCLQKGTRAAGQGLDRYMVDSKYLFFFCLSSRSK